LTGEGHAADQFARQASRSVLLHTSTPPTLR